MDWLDSEEFYDLVRKYRLFPLEDWSQVREAFENVKSAIRREIKNIGDRE